MKPEDYNDKTIINMIKNPHYFLFDPITSLKGVGKSLGEYLSKLIEGEQIIDLLLHFPHRLEKINFEPDLRLVQDQELVLIKGKVQAHQAPARSSQPFKIICYNPTGFFSLVFFKIFPSQLEKLKIGEEIAVVGKIQKHLNDNQINHPQHILEINKINDIAKFNVIYPLSQKLSNKFIAYQIQQILKQLPKSCEEWIDSDFVKRLGFPTFYQALKLVHNPQNQNDLNPENPAIQRLAFDEILASQLAMIMAKNRQKGLKKFYPNQQFLGDKFINSLPFTPTNAQLKAINEINQEIFSSKKITRLIQGDVGSGKTIIAIFTALQNISQGKQACVLVPTTVLAKQHFEYFKKLLINFNLTIEILTSATTKKQKKLLLEKLINGEISILISTHAVLEDDVRFKNLGIAIIDEQHRFGVLQRLKIVEKGENVDLILMSATPIPRSLMLGLYGDMDISIINEKPKNRQKIETTIMSKTKSPELYQAMQKAINNQEKIYWICPAIDENNEENSKNNDADLTSVVQKYQEISNYFEANKVGLLHGKMKESEKEKIMQDFASNQSNSKQILVATTVIEVGIDVPSATIIVIENAEHFGLAQLHQLRGRVGRSDKKSYCILLYGKKYGKNSQARLNILRQSNDGFFIAEEDLKMRGSGEMLGTKQSGFPDFYVANLSSHHHFFNYANQQAKNILTTDPNLKLETNRKYQFLLRIFKYDECLRIINSG
ncbi:MAG: ATP-dependent DNA helicase RecG [Rickettsiales bacterium]